MSFSYRRGLLRFKTEVMMLKAPQIFKVLTKQLRVMMDSSQSNQELEELVKLMLEEKPQKRVSLFQLMGWRESGGPFASLFGVDGWLEKS